MRLLTYTRRKTPAQTLQDSTSQTRFPDLAGRRALIVIDDDNLRISLAEDGRELLYGLLVARLEQRAAAVTPVSVFTTNPGDERHQNMLLARGWDCVVIPRESALTANGIQVKGNADADIAFEIGARYASGRHDALLIGSGDGDLVVAIARGARRAHPRRPIHVFSVLGATSRRITAAVGTIIDSSFLLSDDVLAHTGVARARRAPGPPARHGGTRCASG